MVNFHAGKGLEDLELAILEAETVQDLNTRVQKDKSYHLIVSFRDERPSKEALHDIEQHFAKALGFEQHQRIVAIHHDTENYHLHIAYNKVHPTTFKGHSPAWDYYKRDAVCRAMEKKWNLKIDNGMEGERAKLSYKAQDFEAIRWEVSFESHLKGREDLKKDLQKAKDWEQAQAITAKHGLQFVKTERGLALLDAEGKLGAKASSLGEGFTLCALEERFGPWPQPLQRRSRFKDRLLERKDRIRGLRDAAKSWEDLHQALVQEGLKITPRGNGLALTTLKGRQPIKASLLGKDFSKAALERRFGPFVRRQKRQPAKQPYQRRPRGDFKPQSALWRKFTQRSEDITFKAFRTWREFLILEALSDPPAMAILPQQKQTLQLLESPQKARAKPLAMA